MLFVPLLISDLEMIENTKKFILIVISTIKLSKGTSLVALYPLVRILSFNRFK